MKQHLKNIERKFNTVNKNQYCIDISQNERNLPLPASIYNSFIEQISQKDIFQYPDTTTLYNKLSEYLGVDPCNIMLTPGSDIGIKTVFETLECKGKNVITTDYCFPMYEVYSKLYECNLIKIPYTGMKFNINELIKRIDSNTSFVILSNPNSPLGDMYTLEEIVQILSTGIYVVIDEAYHEFLQQESSVSLIRDFENLVVLKTFSKAFGAAGLRVGYIVSSSRNMEYISKFRFMYEISSISVKYCLTILNNIDYFTTYIQELVLQKRNLVKQLVDRKYTVVDTDASWFFIKPQVKLLRILKDNSINTRQVSLPSKLGSWIKFNYDPIFTTTNPFNL